MRVFLNVIREEKEIKMHLSYSKNIGFFFGAGTLCARNYDPGTGRFLSEDPIGFYGGDESLYRYVQNRIPNFYDSLGLMMNSPDLGAGGGGPGAGSAGQTAGVVIGIVAAGACALGAAPAATQFCLSNPATCNSAVIEGAEFVDSVSDVLGTPTTGLPSYSKGGISGTLVNEILK